MRLKKLRNDILLIDAKDQYELTSTFIRLEEFHESPYERIKGKIFSLETYMDIYAQERGNFTYFQDWDGFNIPDHVVRAFFHEFKYELRSKEITLQRMLQKYLDSDEPFYLIGTHNDCEKLDYIKHEVAHAFFYLDDIYRRKIALEISIFDKKSYKRVTKVLKEWGYCDDVMTDEFQAYMATSGFWYLAANFGFWVMVNNIDVIKEVEAYFEICFDKLDLSNL